MELIAKRSFHKATIVSDRFHVHRLASDAVREIRIKHRREAIDQENAERELCKQVEVPFKAVYSISNRMKILRKAVGLAAQDGLVKDNPMLGYKRKRQEGSIEYLTIEEVTFVEEYKASTPQKQKVIDLFCLGVIVDFA